MAEKKKKAIFGKAKSAVDGIGSKLGKSISDIKDQTASVVEKGAAEVKKQSQKTKETIEAKAKETKTAKEKKGKEKHTIVQLGGSKIKILLPDGYERLKYKNLVKDAAKAVVNTDAAYRKTVGNSDNIVMITKNTPEKVMNPDDVQGLIDGIHGCLSDNQGIIEVKNGITPRGYQYIYSIVKNLSEEPFGGVRYYLRLNLFQDSDIVEIQADFTEIGTTGGREAICSDLARRAGLADIFADGYKDWAKDPYDPDYTNGCLKNLAEKEGLDGLFPENPLSQAHEFLLAVLNDEFVTVRQEADDSEEDTAEENDDIVESPEEKAEREKEFLLGLFVDECRRYTYSVVVEKPKGRKDAAEKTEKQKKSKGDAESENTEKSEKKKRDKLDDQLKSAVTDYNATYTTLNDHGIKLFNQRERALDLLGNIENLINSIANHPKEFDSEIAEIQIKKQEFKDVCDFAKEELSAAQKSAAGAGAGVAGGMAVASVAPSAAMWIATTFGTASTGTAISSLSGAAATKAALAWIGGGALSAGGGGVAAGQAFLAMTGPIGWSIAGATLLTSIVLFANKKIKLDKEKKEEIEAVLKNTEQLKEADAKLDSLLKKTVEIREKLGDQYTEAMRCFGRSFLDISAEDQMLLGTIVNNAKALAVSLGEGV